MSFAPDDKAAACRVCRGYSIPSQLFWNTGSSAFADDDGGVWLALMCAGEAWMSGSGPSTTAGVQIASWKSAGRYLSNGLISTQSGREHGRETPMTTQRLGVIMNGVTGRMGLNQHLVRSIIAIREQGGVKLSNGDRVVPDPILVGRDADKVERLAKQFNVARWTIDLDEALTNPEDG